MKNVKLILLYICLTFILALCSCTSNTTTKPITSEYNELLNEIEQLKQDNMELLNEINSLNISVENLKQNLYDESFESLLESNYYIDSLLRDFFMEDGNDINHTIEIFPGILKSVRVETIDGRMLFIFTIDRMEVNPDWNGPDSDIFLNEEEKYDEYKGGLDTVFEYRGYHSYSEKQLAIIQEYNDGGIYEFFMIDDEIVFVGPDPGP